MIRTQLGTKFGLVKRGAGAVFEGEDRLAAIGKVQFELPGSDGTVRIQVIAQPLCARRLRDPDVDQGQNL